MSVIDDYRKLSDDSKEYDLARVQLDAKEDIDVRHNAYAAFVRSRLVRAARPRRLSLPVWLSRAAAERRSRRERRARV